MYFSRINIIIFIDIRRGPFWGYRNITAKEVKCLSFHGQASQLQQVLQGVDARTVMFDHAEIALHDDFGDATYWQARRSMRFAPVLVKLASNFRAEYLNSEDEADGTVRPDDWTHESVSRICAKGKNRSMDNAKIGKKGETVNVKMKSSPDLIQK